MRTFLFYDIETTGLNTSFDQILSFAAIRTDTKLNEIARDSITIKIRADIVPSPGAFITHRLTLDALAQGVCEYEGALKIHKIVNTPETVSIGYNSLGFDDEFLRFTFYRNLLEPYTHQYSNGCSRIDLLPIATLYRVIRPQIIRWPITDDGKPTLKLELIRKENQFMASAPSHNAMADVETSIELAKHLIKEEKIWQFALSLFDKNSEKLRFDKLFSQTSNNTPYPFAVMISHKFGADSTYIAPVIGIGRSYHYLNQTLWIRLDNDIFSSSEMPFAIRKKDGEIGIILPPRFKDLLSKEQIDLCDKNLSIINHNQESRAIFDKAVEYHRQFKYPLVPEADLDSLLYQSDFFSRLEKNEIERFHRASLEQKVQMVKNLNPCRVKDIATRILFRNYLNNNSVFDLVSKDYETYMELVRCSIDDPDFNTKKIVGFRQDERLVPQKAIEELKIICNTKELDSEQQEILKWLEKYILSI
ncbi:MAG: exodeoxyribonuclease I [Desulfamplus sp.]|nr:exodeoxyribonuclease I [Desulfamplus sp.]